MKYLNKLIEYGLYLFVLLLPWQTRWIVRQGMINDGYSEYSSISLYGVDVLLVVLILLFMATKFSIFNFHFLNKSKIENSKFSIPVLWWLIACLELFVFISILFAPDKVLALYRYGVFLLGVGLFWLISCAAYSKIKLVYSLLAGIFLQACLGIYQFVTQSGFAFKWLGLAAHNPADSGASVVETLNDERWLRAYGGLDHPNILGGVLVVGILLVIYLIFNHGDFVKFPITNDQLPNKSKIQNLKFYTLYFILYTFYVALFFTFSRGAWLACLAGILTMLLVLFWRKDLIGQKKLLSIILLFVVIGGVLTYLYNNLVLTRLSQDTRLEQKSTQERISSCGEARQLIKQHPLFGVGIGNYTLAINQEIKPGQPSYYYQPAHNVFLLVWAEIGILGFIFWLLILGYFIIFNFQFSIFNESLKNLKLKNCLKIENCKLEIKKNENQKNNLLILSLFVAMVVMLIPDHWLWSLHFGVLFFWLVMGALIRKDELRLEPQKS